MLLVLLSGLMLFLGVVSLAWGDRPLVWGPSLVVGIVGVIPMAIVAGLLAVCIEGGTVFASAMRKDVVSKVRQELSVLEKAKARYRMKDESFAARKREIEVQLYLPTTIMIVCSLFSITGAEIFWQNLLQNQVWYFHIIGFILGLVCSALLMIFELNGELIERVIERCISSSGLIQSALDQSARSKIHDRLFSIRAEKLDSPEFDLIMQKAAEQGLLGVVTESVKMAGMNVSAQQLQKMVEEVSLETQQAENFIASGGVEALPPPRGVLELNKRRKNANRDKVERLYRREGQSRLESDTGRYASELGMDARTFERHLKDVIANG